MSKYLSLTALLFLAGPTLLTYGVESHKQPPHITVAWESLKDGMCKVSIDIPSHIKLSEKSDLNATFYYTRDPRFPRSPKEYRNPRLSWKTTDEGVLLIMTTLPLCRDPNVTKLEQDTARRALAALHRNIGHTGTEAAIEEILRRYFSESISKSVDNSLLNGDDVTAFSSTVLSSTIDVIATKRIPTDISKKLAVELIAKYVARKSVTTSIWAVNWCHRTLRGSNRIDTKEGGLIDIKKHQDAIMRVQYFAGNIASYAVRNMMYRDVKIT